MYWAVGRPHENPGGPGGASAGWDELRDALYTLAVLFGVLRLPKGTLYGVWIGKSGEDWQRRRLDFDCRSELIEEKLRRSLTILAEYDATQ